MPLLTGLMGIASPIAPQEAHSLVGAFLVQGEQVVQAFKHNRDIEVFTNIRVISVDVQGMTGSKKSFRSIPYAKIQSWSITTASTIDVDAELVINVSGSAPMEMRFSRGCDVAGIQRTIAAFACGAPPPPPQQYHHQQGQYR